MLWDGGGRGGTGTQLKGKVWIRRKKNEIKSSDHPQTGCLAGGPRCRWPVLAPGCHMGELGARDTVIGLCSPIPPPPAAAAPRVSAMPPAGPGAWWHPGGHGARGPQNGADLREGRAMGDTAAGRLTRAGTTLVPPAGMSLLLPALCPPILARACDTSTDVPACCLCGCHTGAALVPGPQPPWRTVQPGSVGSTGAQCHLRCPQRSRVPMPSLARARGSQLCPHSPSLCVPQCP